MWAQSFDISVPRLSGYSWLSVCPAVSSSASANVNLDMVLKQLEPQQMQMRVLRVRSDERKEHERNRHRGVTDAEAARDTFLQQPLKQTPAAETEAPGEHQRSCSL